MITRAAIGTPVAPPPVMVATRSPQQIAFRPERAYVAPSTATLAPPGPDPVALRPMSLSAARVAETMARRIATGITELDRVLGGGLVDGAPILIGGDPGQGKSTLLLQVVHALARNGLPSLYVSGEESIEQISLRAQRLDITNERISVVASEDLDAALELASATQPAVIVFDSIQKMRTAEIDTRSEMAQIAECASRIRRFAKATGTPVFVVGQVTKDGQIAGPKSLEHEVDVVLYLEAGGGARRNLISFKNRHGSTDEIGMFEMREGGLVCVDEPDAALQERAAGVPGSAVFPAVIGERVQMVEIQALVGGPKTPRGDAPAKGSLSVSGVDAKRVQMILAILAKHAEIDISDRDVFVSATAGTRVTDPAADLAIALAIASSVRDLPIDPTAIAFGELGLAGEIRSVSFARARGTEGRRAGFGLAVVSVRDAHEALATAAKSLAEAIELVIGQAVAVAS